MHKAYTFQTEVEEGEIKYAMDTNPTQAMKDLYDPKKWTHVDPEKKGNWIETAKRATNLDLSIDLQRLEKTQQMYNINQRSLLGGLARKEFAGGNITNDVLDAVDKGLLDRTGLSEIMEFNKALSEGRDIDDDPAAKSRLALGIFGPEITTTQHDLNEAAANHVIGTKTFEKYTNDLTERQDKKTGKDFSQAEKELNLLFETEPAFSAKFDRGAKVLHAEAMEELYGLVYGKDKMPVDKAFDIVKDKYVRSLNVNLSSEKKDLLKALVIPGKEKASIDDMKKWLLANKENMAHASFIQQAKMLKDLDWIENALQIKKEHATAKQQENKSKTSEKELE
jgi:hypothetical protein